MAQSGEKNIKKSVIQISIGFLIALIVALMSIVSREYGAFQFYELIELKLLDQRFIIRGEIPLDPNVGTIDIDALTLGFEGRYQDWTRDKYAQVIRALHDLDSRMIGFDVFFPEATTEILKKEDFLLSGVENIEDVGSLFRDYDEDMRQAMLESQNVLIGQSFEIAERQDADWVSKNTGEKSDVKIRSLEALSGFSKEYPEWAESGLPLYTDIEHPLEKFIGPSEGVGFAMTVADIDGSVRRYPVVLTYDGKLWPSLALVMYLNYIGASFGDVEVVPGKEIILPPGQLPSGEEVQVRIPINDEGLMMVNWAGNYWDEQFFHIPHISLVKNRELWQQAKVIAAIKKIFVDNEQILYSVEELLADPSPLIQAYVESGLEVDDTIMENTLWLLICREIEHSYIAQDRTPEALPPYWEGLLDFETYLDAYQELNTNHKISAMFHQYPDLTLDAMSDSVEVYPANKIRLGYYTIKDRLAKGGLTPADYPLYFTDPEVNGKILTAEDFVGKVFVYGLTAAGTHDLNPMPYNNRYPMVGLYANIFSMLTTRNFLYEAGPWVNLSLLFIFGIVMGVSVPRFKPLTGVLIALALLAGFLISAQILFQKFGLVINVFGPIIVIAVGYTSITVYNFFSEEKEKKMIRGIFSRYVTKSVVDELIKHPDMVKLGGEKKVLTVFFSDVAGFTTLSEKLEPEELVAHLNEYLTVMSNIILKYDGMIDKYEGDAIMAVFGTPVMYEDHAARACLVSLEMQDELVKLREKWREEGKPELYVRIGLNTGPMVVGNMGAADRLDYTVMGDSVNLGSRLEGANKQYGTYIMISESTLEAAKDTVEVRFLDSLRVKGKLKPVNVYEVLGKADDGLPDSMVKMREYYEMGIEKYLDKDWNAGIGHFEKVLEIKPDDGPAKVYVDRCIMYKENPPPSDWDGVFTMTTK
ncbi:CHASE2 domain-containing protein [candidate division KSB1 bacterium]